MKFNLTPTLLKASEESVFSQGGQDGVLWAIFGQIGDGGKSFVEFGARDGVDCSNTANLRINHGWHGELWDAEPLSGIVNKKYITKTSINRYIKHYLDIDYLSIDIDGNDYWIWESLKNKPRVVTIEYN